VCVTIAGPEREGEEELSQRLGQTCPQVVVIDAPTQIDISQLCKVADGLRLHRRQEVVKCRSRAM
jgi:hypothetical protein